MIRTRHYILILLGVWQLIWLISFWPANVDANAMYTLEHVLRNSLAWWNSSTYSLITLWVWNWTGEIAILPILQCTLFLILISFGLKVYEREKTLPRGLPWIVAFLFLLSPYTSITLIRLSKETAHALFLSLLCLSIPYYGFTQKMPRLFTVVFLGMVLGFSAELRLDSQIYLILFPLALLLLSLWEVKRIALVAIVACVTTFLIGYVVPMKMDGDSLFGDAYRMSPYENTLAYFVHNEYQTENRERDIEIISKVYDFEKFKTFYSPYESLASAHGAFLGTHSAEEFQNVRNLFFRTVFHNPIQFLKHRLDMGLGMFGFNYQARFFPDERFPILEATTQKDLAVSGEVFERIHFKNGRFTQLMNQLYRSSLSSPTRFLGATLLIPFLILFWAIISFKVARFSAMAALLILARAPIVCLFAPTTNFCYAFSILLGAYLLLPFIMVERSRSMHVLRS